MSLQTFSYEMTVTKYEILLENLGEQKVFSYTLVNLKEFLEILLCRNSWVKISNVCSPSVLENILSFFFLFHA